MDDQPNKEELNIRDVIRTVKKTYRYLLTKWLIIVIVGITGGVLGLIYALNSDPHYEASLSFVLSNTNNDNSGLLNLAGQFGLNLGSNNNDAFTGDNIVTLMTSRTMLQKALQTKIPEKNITLLNSFVKINEIDKGLAKKERFQHVYPFPENSDLLTPIQDSFVRVICKAVSDGYLSVSRPDKQQSIFVVTTTSGDELFSNYLTRSLVAVTSKFYIDTKTSTSRDNLEMLQHEADSLRRILNKSVASSASIYDKTFNLNEALQSQRVPAQQDQLQVAAASGAYGEVVKNLEIAKIALMKETPLYQIIDEPHLPLEAKKPGKLFSIIIGGFIAGVVIITFLLIRKFLSIYS